MRNVTLTALLLPPVLLLGADRSNRAQPTYVYPLIQGHGGIVRMPDAAQPPKAGARVLFDITSDAGAAEVTKGLDRAALFLNLYTDFGVRFGEIRAAIHLHGDATKAALKNMAYRKHAGVEVYVCAQALAHRNYGLDEVADAVDVAASAATVNVNKQTDGYARIPF